MSGGSFNYAYARVADFSDDLESRLDGQGSDSGDGYAAPKWPEEVESQLRKVVLITRLAASLMKETEWLFSSDIGEDTFLQRVAMLAAPSDESTKQAYRALAEAILAELTPVNKETSRECQEGV